MFWGTWFVWDQQAKAFYSMTFYINIHSSMNNKLFSYSKMTSPELIIIIQLLSALHRMFSAIPIGRDWQHDHEMTAQYRHQTSKGYPPFDLKKPRYDQVFLYIQSVLKQTKRIYWSGMWGCRLRKWFDSGYIQCSTICLSTIRGHLQCARLLQY